MPRITLGTVVKILLASFVVGLLLAFLNVSPQELFTDVYERGKGLFDWAVSALGWAASYVLLGALVVVPIWLVLYLWRALRKKK